MAFKSTRPFGFSSGFEPGHENASPFGASHPEIFGLGTIGEAARQMSQFPVIAGGGGGVPIPGFSQVEGSRPERGAHDRQQGREGDGFDQNARIGRKRALGEVLPGVAAHEDHLDVRPPVLHSLGELGPAVVVGHDNVREQEVDGARILVQHREGARGVARGQDPVPPRLQDVLNDLHDGWFVVYDQHRRGHGRVSRVRGRNEPMQASRNDRRHLSESPMSPRRQKAPSGREGELP
jgi:hypothetical protein